MSEKIISRGVMGNAPVVRVLDFLIEGRGLEYSLVDVKENSNVGLLTLIRIWNYLLKLELVVFTRKIGGVNLFKLNQKSFAVKKLVKFYDALLFQETEKYLSEKNYKRKK